MQEPGVLKTFARRATKLLELLPCKTFIVYALKELGLVARIHFCNWFLQSIHVGEVDPWYSFSSAPFPKRPGLPYTEW